MVTSSFACSDSDYYRTMRSIPFPFPVGMDVLVYATQRHRPQHGSISRPQKIPSKYWVLKICGRSSKKCNYPAHIYWSLSGSCCSDQAITHLLKKRSTARFNLGSTGSMGPHRQPPNQSSPSQPTGRPCGYWQHPSPM